MRKLIFVALLSALAFTACEDKKKSEEVAPTAGSAGAVPSASAGAAGEAGAPAPGGSASNPDGGDAGN
jgi:hypothetical protein